MVCYRSKLLWALHFKTKSKETFWLKSCKQYDSIHFIHNIGSPLTFSQINTYFRYTSIVTKISSFKVNFFDFSEHILYAKYSYRQLNWVYPIYIIKRAVTSFNWHDIMLNTRTSICYLRRFLRRRILWTLMFLLDILKVIYATRTIKELFGARFSKIEHQSPFIVK